MGISLFNVRLLYADEHNREEEGLFTTKYIQSTLLNGPSFVNWDHTNAHRDISMT